MYPKVPNVWNNTGDMDYCGSLGMK